MHIVLLCATQRGLRFLQRLRQLCPDDRLTVFSFREDQSEPIFLEATREFCEAHGVRFFETRNPAAAQSREVWSEEIDLLFMVHWRYLLPNELIKRIRLASVVFHDSLLPAYRGFSPTTWAMINGEKRCGATMFHAADAVDSGDIIDQVGVDIETDDTIAELIEKTTEGYLTMLEKNIDPLKSGRAPRRAQDHSRATYTCKRIPEDNRIDWRQPTRRIFDLIRASTHPYPGAFTEYQGARMMIWTARPDPTSAHFVGAIPGRVVEIVPGEGVVVLTADGTLLVSTIQMPGGPEVCASDAIRRVAATLGRDH